MACTEGMETEKVVPRCARAGERVDHCRTTAQAPRWSPPRSSALRGSAPGV